MSNTQNESSNKPEATPVYYMAPQYPVEEDEINLLDYWRILMRFKWLIVFITGISGAASIALAFHMTPIYRAEVTLAPVTEEKTGGLAALAGQFGGLASLAGVNLGGGSGKVEEAIATLESRQFTDQFIQDKNLLPHLYQDLWDESSKSWKVEDPKDTPTLWKAFKFFDESVRSVSSDNKSGMYTLAIEWHDPELATQWANELVARINAHQKKAAIEESKKSIEYLQNQANETSIVEMRQAIFRLIEAQTKNIMLANVRDEFVFKVIDPAVVPERPIKPKKKLMAILGVLVGFMLSVFLAFFIAFIKKQKTLGEDEQEQTSE